MGYKLLGMMVWKSRKWILGRMFPGAKPLIAGGLLLVIAGVVLGARQRAADE
jgi:hypothetical protein